MKEVWLFEWVRAAIVPDSWICFLTIHQTLVPEENSHEQKKEHQRLT
jgi:hypothetical protein